MSSEHPLPPRTIVVESLACRRGERVLFEDLSLAVDAGGMLVLRGPNGAGKTTLLHALAGIVHPAAGTIRILGGDPEERTETHLHLLGHRAAVKARLSVVENLKFWAALNGVGAISVADALETVGLAGIAGLDAGYLSAGQTRRLALARLLVSPRPIWLLDEPTSALDAAGEALLAVLLGAHLAWGGIVVAATHHDIGLAGTFSIRTLTLGGGA